MFIWVIVFETLMISALLYIAGEQYHKRQRWQTLQEKTQLGHEHANIQLVRCVSEVDHLSDLLAQQRIEHVEELRRRERRMDQREKDLLGQVQVMAERLAGLKLEGGPDGERVVDSAEIPFTPDNATEPYPPELFSFVNAIETEEAREMVENYIEVQRAAGRDDMQTLDQLRRGDYVDG